MAKFKRLTIIVSASGNAEQVRLSDTASKLAEYTATHCGKQQGSFL